MLPFAEVWDKISPIFEDREDLNTSKKIKEYDEETITTLLEAKGKFLWETAEFAHAIDEFLQDSAGFDFTYRYKENESLVEKLQCQTLTKQMYKTLNDVLGMRFVIQCTEGELQEIVYKFVNESPYDEACRISDQTEGKANNDGYRGIHVYIQPNRNIFPVEIQFWTRTHALLNEYLHDNIYKIGDNEGLIPYAISLREWFDSVPEFPNKELTLHTYVDFIYEKAFSVVIEEGDEDE
jgi:ppGpp synthetase/RelA/SpoT-type nucleotidyltranferase